MTEQINQKIRAQAEQLRSYCIGFRRDIHMHPEFGFHEYRTTERICEELDKLGISYHRLDPTGVTGKIVGTAPDADPSRIICLRADIDALPIQEMENGLPYRSVHDGVMHACGHDTHQAMLLTALRILNEMRDELSGTVRFVFQPAEETSDAHGNSGADAAIAQGVAENVRAFFGMHILANENGRLGIGCAKGEAMAGNLRFSIVVHGKGCHGAEPESGADALLCGAAIVQNLQQIISRNVSPQDAAVITVGSFHSGKASNVVAAEAEISGTGRFFARPLRELLPRRIREIAQSTAQAYGASAEVTIKFGHSPVINDPELVDIGMESAKKVMGTNLSTCTLGG